MKLGIVFKIEENKAVILKADGSFVSVVAKKDWQVGEAVSISQPRKGHIKLILTTAACLALVMLGGVGFNLIYNAPISLISIDVNPSIELSVNRFGKIVSAVALNQEGEQILSETATKNIAYGKALSSILSAQGESGYLTTDANVVLTVFSSDTALQASLLSELQALVDYQISLYSTRITTEYHAVDEHTVNGAHGHGVTAGKYLYLCRLTELAPEADISQYAYDSIEQIKGEIKACQQGHGKTEQEPSHGGHHKRKRRGAE